MRRALFTVIASIVWAMCWAVAAHAADVVIVSSERSPSYEAAAEAVVAELERKGQTRMDVAQWAASELENAALSGGNAPRLFIALGTEALKRVLGRDVRVPVVAALIPRSGYERVLKEYGKKSSAAVTAVYLDQPFGRQLDLLRLAIPEAQRVGVLWGPESVQQQPMLASALQSRGMQELSGSVAVNGSIFAGLKAALDGADVMLAVADPQVFNSATISNVLLTTYRAGVPVLAFSPAYVKAGALLSLHTTPAQIGTQVGLMARPVVQGGALPPAQYPVEFSVSVNEHVARSLGLMLDTATLADRLRRLEKRP